MPKVSGPSKEGLELIDTEHHAAPPLPLFMANEFAAVLLTLP